MKSVAIKITVLSMTSLISSLLTVSFRAISYFTVADQDGIAVIIYGIFVNAQVFWLQIDTVISSLCLILFLPKTKSIYEFCCCCCIAMTRKCYHKQEMRSQSHIELSTSRQTTADELKFLR